MLERQTVIWRLVSFKMSIFPESEDSHKQPKRNGFHVCGTRVDGRVTVYVKYPPYQEQMVCLCENRVSMVSSRPTCKLESYGETVNITHTWSKKEGLNAFMLLTIQPDIELKIKTIVVVSEYAFQF